MNKIILFLFIFFNFLNAQVLDSIQIIRSFQIGIGRIINILALQQNSDDVEYITGWNFNANYLFPNLSRIEISYCTFEPIDISSFWQKVHFWNINVNYHHIISTQDGTFFIYPYFGAAYSQFKGFQLLDKNFKRVMENKTYNQFGFNAGLGAEWHLRFLTFFVDYNMRITRILPYNSISLRNVGFSAGIRLFYFQLHWHKHPENLHKSKHKKRKRRKLFDILHDRYHWF
ncbi:MAG: hypothetical protein KatS3mg027_2015 [Bacteroidia bacterium]|nr:MAG: hypothetical protein KatS3mg027_2015 [Bacteroidia bacterium]